MLELLEYLSLPDCRIFQLLAGEMLKLLALEFLLAYSTSTFQLPLKVAISKEVRLSSGMSVVSVVGVSFMPAAPLS
jgi:hypothetical protein